jgi:autotransporter-associated beta strand protein
MVQSGSVKIRGSGAFDIFLNGTIFQPRPLVDPSFFPLYSPTYGASVNYSVQSGQNAWISTNGVTFDTSVITNIVSSSIITNIPVIYIGIDLQHDASLGVTHDGGLSKIGTGGLILSSNCTYTGSTIVSNGTLLVLGTIASSPVTVHAGATLGGTGTIGGTVTNNGTLSPGTSIGTLTLNSNVVLSAGSTNVFEVDATTPANDQVTLGAAVTYGGVLQIVPTGTFTNGQNFTLFSGPGATSVSNFVSIAGSPGIGKAFTFTNGVLTVVSTVSSPSPTTLTNSYSGGVLTLTWPAGQSWRLVGQTNSLSTGLNPATNAWFTVPGGIDGSNNITISPANPTVFYRLVYP